MRKLFLLCSLCLALFNLRLQAQENEFGYFNSLSVGANIGTTGWGLDMATPLGNHFALRAGFTIMPNICYSDNVDVSIDMHASYIPNGKLPASIDVEGSMSRTAGEILLNYYPFKKSSFFLSGGAVFGGDKLIKIKGHSDEMAQYQDMAGKAGIEFGNYHIPIDANGNVSGGIKVSSSRPYLGLGFGRIVPKNKRLGFLFELGVQIHGTPEVYTDYGKLGDLLEKADNDFSKILEKTTLYPVLRFRLCGKIF